jgi:hypothetical protein
MTACVICGATTTAYACTTCATNTSETLTEIARLAPELDAAIAKQGVSGGNGAGGDSDPIPIDMGASDATHAITNTITTLARAIADDQDLTLTIGDRTAIGPLCHAGWDCGHTTCQDIRTRRKAAQIPALCRWLATQTGWIRHQPDARDTMREIDQVNRRILGIVDRSTPKWWAGPCTEPIEGRAEDCGADLYATPGADTVRCPECLTRYSARDRKAWLLEAARDHHAHAELIGRALAALGLPATAQSVHGLARTAPGRTPRITATGVDAAGRRVYRVGDVLDVLAMQEDERERRQLAAAERSIRVWLRSLPTPGPVCEDCRHKSCARARTQERNTVGVAA